MLSKQYNADGTDLVNEEKDGIFKFFLIALFLRIIMLILIYFLSDIFEPYLYIDDWKYYTYAKLYQNIAAKAIDLNAFKIVDRKIGGVVVAQLYFRLNAILYYLTKSEVFLRLSNIFFSSLTVVPIFYITKELFGKKEAETAALIFACMPYHIIMSAFLFKDILIVLLMSSSLYMIIKFYKYKKLNISLFLILTIPLQWLRPGMSLFLFGVLGFAIITKLYSKNKINKIFIIFLVPITILILIKFVLIDNLEYLSSRFEIYMETGREYMGNISLIRIDSLSQLYKLPLTWFFSTFFPISFNINVDSWLGALGLLNYTSVFIAPGYILYALFYDKDWDQKIFFYPMLALHLLVIIAVINIPRHYYFLHFYIIICSSAYITKLEGNKKISYILIIIMMLVGLLLLALLTS